MPTEPTRSTWCYWIPEWDATEADARVVEDVVVWEGFDEAYQAERIASHVMEEHHMDWDCPEELTFVVQSPKGQQWEVLAYAEPSICFRARAKTGGVLS